MDARLDSFSDELCQVNTRVGRIAWQQARLGGFATSPSPSPEASVDEDGDDENASSPVIMRWRPLIDLPFVIHDKKGE